MIIFGKTFFSKYKNFDFYIRVGIKYNKTAQICLYTKRNKTDRGWTYKLGYINADKK